MYKKLDSGKKINQIIFNRNALSKKVALEINKNIIDNIKNEELEREEMEKRKKKMEELSNKYIVISSWYEKLDNENIPKLEKEENFEITDYFEKGYDYRHINIAKENLKKIVYRAQNFFNSTEK